MAYQYSQRQAKIRVQIKRRLRELGLVFKNDDSTKRLKAELERWERLFQFGSSAY